MSIQRVQQSGFAQVANGALRDKRLSWKARGLLAFVLSHSEEFSAPREWLEKQSDHDGQHAVRGALKELTDLGYRKVTKVQDAKTKHFSTIVEWNQYPYGDPNFKYPE